MYDVMNNLSSDTIQCLDNGFVKLVDVMPRLVPDDVKSVDCAIVQAARVSYGQGTKKVSEDRDLIRYLMRHQHTTPFEMVETKWHVKLPIFVARQMIRHRTASVNEISGRYSILKDEFYKPTTEDLRSQSKTNRQGGDDKMDIASASSFLNYLDNLCESTYKEYEKFTDLGMAREQARMVLPINVYTEWYWKVDLHNLLHFLALRCDQHAQWEIRVFGEAMLSLIKPIAPIAFEAWEDYNINRGAIKLTKLEMEALKSSVSGLNPAKLETTNKREQQEWLDKAKKLGMMGENLPNVV